MMNRTVQVEVITSEDRGKTENSWLHSLHSFSFGPYHNLNRLNFGTLRVLNDDIIQPGKGFGMHSHDNMEIITIVLEGAVAHKDSKGNEGVLCPGQVQRMTAGKGIRHSEFNPSKKERLRLLQLWIYPKQRNLEPSYESKEFVMEKNRFIPLVRETPSEETLTIHQDASLYLGQFNKGIAMKHQLPSQNHGDYLYVIEGDIALGDKILKAGDAAQVTRTEDFEIKMLSAAKVLMIEVRVTDAL